MSIGRRLHSPARYFPAARFLVSCATVIMVLLIGSCIAQDRHGQSVALFKDVTQESGFHFRHHSPLTDARHTHLTMGSGVACFDFDGDTWTDILLGQGCAWEGKFLSGTKQQDTLLRNERGTFREITSVAGLQNPYFATGITSCDADNDGFDDLFVTSIGRNLLYRNNGDGTVEPGISLPPAEDSYSASAAWTDVNGDGNPDLFVSRYVRFTEQDYPICTDQATGLGIVCPPETFSPLPDVLLVSRGDGTFADQSETAGLRNAQAAPGLGVVTNDLDDDGDLDIFVANDAFPNHLWLNDGQGHFSENGLLSGVALNGRGLREACMGVALGDATGDGRADLVVTNYFDETNTFYRNQGAGVFLDVSSEIGVGAPSRSRLGFGCSFLDADGDSDLDLFVANGHIHDRLTQLGRKIPYEQPAQLLTFQDGRFQDVSRSAGEYFSRPVLGRGAAILDFDQDLQTDLAISHLDSPAVLLRNITQNHGHTLKLRLVGRSATRAAVGAQVAIRFSGIQPVVRYIDGGSSYLSCSERVIFASCPASTQARVEIRWPGGASQTIDSLEAPGSWCIIERRPGALEMP